MWAVKTITRAVASLGWGALAVVAVDATLWRVPVAPDDPFQRLVTLALAGAASLGVGMVFLGTKLYRTLAARVPLPEQLVCALLACLACGAFCFRGNLPQRTFPVPVHISLSNIPPDPAGRQTFYLTGIADANGRMIVPASNLYAHATVQTGCRLENKGHGIWSDLPAMGKDFSLEWAGTVQAPPGMALRLTGGTSVTGSVLRVTANGRSTVIPIGGTGDAKPYKTPILEHLSVPLYRILRILLAIVLSAPLWLMLLWVRASENKNAHTPEGAAPNQTPALPLRRFGLLALLIIGAVVLFNLHVPFADLLWHDDALWYFKSPSIVSEGLSRVRWYGTISPLATFRAYLYTYGMFTWGIPATRLIFILILSFASLLQFLIYERVFHLRSQVAVFAAIMPNILPRVIGIPIGLNTTYAVFSLIPVLLSVLLIFVTLTRTGWRSFVYGIAAVTAFWSGLAFSGAGVFLGPCLLVFCGCFVVDTNYRAKALFWSLPIAMLTVQKAILQATRGPKKVVNIPFEEICHRASEFINVSALVPPSYSFAVPVTVGLMLIGACAIFMCPQSFVSACCPDRKPPKLTHRMLLIVWPICWITSNGYAYVAKSADFRPYDYAYIFNYGSVFLQVAALFSIAASVALLFRRQQIRRIFSAVLVSAAVIYVGLQRIAYGNETYRPYEAFSQAIRSGISNCIVPKDAQVYIHTDLDDIDHLGNYMSNSGYLQYVLGRRDVNAIIGPCRYPNDPFRDVNGWFDIMGGLSADKPFLAFRMAGDTLVPIGQMLRVYMTEQQNHTQLAWTLFDIHQPLGTLAVKSEGKTLSGLRTYLSKSGIFPVSDSSIAFYDPKDQSDLVTGSDAEDILSKPSFLDHPIALGDAGILVHAAVLRSHDGCRIQASIRVLKTNSYNFKVGYRIAATGWAYRVIPLWLYAKPGDIVVLMSDALGDSVVKTGATFELINMGTWPYAPLHETVILKVPNVVNEPASTPSSTSSAPSKK